ncbi:MAG: leucine--tRNA ligase [Lysobacterales bacterium]
MDPIYNPHQLEPEIQSDWDAREVYRVTEDPDREKYYCLSMLPYPSGALHMGHVRNYMIGDVISRYERMCGKNVLQPMGWDAFGLPAENAAIKNKVPPARWTYANIDHMRGQLKRLGYAYDWSREVTTCRPDYYRWEQQMFVRLFKKGLVYRRNATVNFDPVDQTVLANEQVVDGRGWRSGALVERREIPQWFLKITDYAQELLDNLDDLEGWPESVKTMQRNWIGRSEGAEFSLKICDADGEVSTGHALAVYTTRPDTSFGMTYCVLAPEHPLINDIVSTEQRNAVTEFQATAAAASEIDRLADGSLEKRGVFTGAYALNPFTRKPVPVYLADYVLMGYGTGAIMAVPGQDQRDWDFAKAYDLPIIRSVQPPEDFDGEAFKGDGPAINSDWLDGLGVDEAKEKAMAWLEAEGLGQRTVNFRLRDWGVSRQRYWGCPIPMIRCEACGDVPVPEEDLPVVLPEDVEFMGVQSPIKADPKWRQTICPTCGASAERETDTFDTFMESSWYYARYCCPDADAMVDERANYWLPVDQYVGGIEHAILHLMYFRFYHKLMRDAGLLTSDEPATRLLCQGMVVAETFYREDADGAKHFFSPADVELAFDDRGAVSGATLASDGKPVAIGSVEKMSKSKNNGVDPVHLIEQFGADTVRLFSVSDSPPHQSLEWSESGVEGANRFIKRLWRNVSDHVAQVEEHGPAPELDPTALQDSQKTLYRKLHETLDKVGDDLGRRRTFNTAIAAVMELVNAASRHNGDSDADRALLQRVWEQVTTLLTPMVPHVCQALWLCLGRSGDVIDEPWPKSDPAALVRDELEIVVQVNGKVRGRINVGADASKEAVEAEARVEPNVVRFIGEGTIRKVIVVPGKLVNIVVAG